MAIQIDLGGVVSVGGGRSDLDTREMPSGRAKLLDREQLAAILWADQPPPTWRAAVRNAASQVRSAAVPAERCRERRLPCGSGGTTAGGALAVLSLTRWRNGRRTDTLLGSVHPSGEWMGWFGRVP